jgi:C-terminal processing protease CtpA/Prc
VLTPREVVDRRAYLGARVGIFLTVADNRVVVRDVESDSPAARADVRRGDVVAIANGIPLDADFVRQAQADGGDSVEFSASDVMPTVPRDAQDAARNRVLRAVRRILRPNESAQPLQLGLERDAGATLRQVVLTPTSRAQPPVVEHRWLDNKVLVIRFTRFLPEVRAGLARALEEAQDARAIVIDLRGNSGGQLAIFQWFTGHFFSEPREAFRLVRRDAPGSREQIATPLRVSAREPHLRQPIAVLIDSGTGSAAELTAVALAESRGALLVGETSCGCATSVRTEYVLPDNGGLRIAEDGFVSTRGLRLEGEPISPALRVTPSLAELRSGRDVVLDAAVRRLAPRAAAGRLTLS